MILDQNNNKWYKGNLHTHSTDSDGKLPPDEVFALYRKNGYDFMALTDHYHYRAGGVEPCGILCISGAEYDVGDDAWEGIYHITGLGCTEEPQLFNTDKRPAQEIIDEIHRCGGLAILAHPAWSMNRPEEIVKLRNLDGLEIYNTVSGVPWNARPDSGSIVDQLALRGWFNRCLAVDDAHFYNGDACRSYIMVKAEECTREALLAAILRGDFYATQGPEFSVEQRENELIVHCTPVHDVTFYSNLVYTSDRDTRGDAVTEARYTIKPRDRFVRIELVDADGSHAWSAAFPVNAEK